MKLILLSSVCDAYRASGCVGFSSADCVFLCHSETGGKQKEVQVPKEEAKLLIRDFDPSKEYNFKIVAVRGRQQSKPLQAKHEGERRERMQIFKSKQSDVTDE